jgi:hypothetical protein
LAKRTTPLAAGYTPSTGRHTKCAIGHSPTTLWKITALWLHQITPLLINYREQPER